MRGSMLLLSLIAALSGGPLRHSEAADDLARLLAPDVLQAIDGGVGDDSGASLRGVEIADDAPGQAGLAEVPTFLDAPRPSPLLSSPRLRVERSNPPPNSSGRREPWLARFLF